MLFNDGTILKGNFKEGILNGEGTAIIPLVGTY